MRRTGWLLIVVIGFLAMGRARAQHVAKPENSDSSDQKIEIIDNLMPYPEEARAKGLGGNVVLHLLLSEKGDVKRVEILRSDNPIFDKVADSIGHQMRSWFSAADSGLFGKWITLTLCFRIHKSPPPIEGTPDYSGAPPKGSERGCPDVLEEPREFIPFRSLIQYPREALKRGLEGKVTIQALLSKKGFVEKAEILKSSNPIFNEEALRVMREEEFTPPMQNGTPLRIWITRTMEFKLPSKLPSRDTVIWIKRN